MLINYQKVSIYQADKCVLKDVNFHVDEGEFTYLIGKVGSGKSSLLKTLYCELDLVEGETEKAEILGRDLKVIKRKEIPALRKELGKTSSCSTTAPCAKTSSLCSRLLVGKRKTTSTSASRKCSTR